MARGGTSGWGVALVVGLFLVAAVLVALALRPPEPPPATIVVATPTATPTAQPTPTESPEASPSPTADGQPEAAPAPASRELPLDVLDAQSAIRATPGTCPGGGASIETTSDGGASWQGVFTPADSVMRVTRESNAQLWFIGSYDAGCTAGLWRTWVLGVEWDGPSGTAGSWHLESDPASRQVHAPDGLVASPCGERLTVELEAASPSEAYVLCEGGEVFATSDAGASWGSSGTASGAVALALVDGAPVVAVAGAEACDGLGTGPVGEPTRGCAQGVATTEVALAFAGPGAGFLLAGGQTYLSGDGGASWRPA